MINQLSISNAFGRAIQPFLPWSRGTPCPVFLEALGSVIRALNGDPTRVACTVNDISTEIGSSVDNSVEEFEKRLKGLLSSLVPNCRDRIDSQLAARTDLIIDQIWRYLPSSRATVLDWGCGNGAVGERIARKHVTVLVDVHDHRSTGFSLPYFLYDEENPIPNIPGNIDVLLLLTVLHHAKNPIRTIEHALSSSPRRIIVIESVPDLPEDFFENCSDGSKDRAFQYCAFVDWFYNRVICDDVQMTYNYQHASDWIVAFQRYGYSVVEHVPLGIDQPLVPEWHVLLVFERMV